MAIYDYPEYRQTFCVASNDLQTTLTANITSVSTSIPVTSTTGFPTSGVISIDNEIMFYYLKTPTLFLIESSSFNGRGFDNTTATSHLATARVERRVIAKDINDVDASSNILMDVVGYYGTTPLYVSYDLTVDHTLIPVGQWPYKGAIYTDSVSGDKLIVNHSTSGSHKVYVGRYVGTTDPSTGIWTKDSGTGVGTLSVLTVDPGTTWPINIPPVRFDPVYVETVEVDYYVSRNYTSGGSDYKRNESGKIFLGAMSDTVYPFTDLACVSTNKVSWNNVGDLNELGITFNIVSDPYGGNNYLTLDAVLDEYEALSTSQSTNLQMRARYWARGTNSIVNIPIAWMI